MQAAGGGGGGGATVPRNFKLLDELEEAERSIKGGADVSLGLAGDDPSLSSWNCSIFAQAGGGEPRMWSLSLYCDKDYPAKPPTIKFSSKVAMDCVDAKGNVSAPPAPCLRRACEARARRERAATSRSARSLARSLKRCPLSLVRARLVRHARARACALSLGTLSHCASICRSPPPLCAGRGRQGAVPGLVEPEQDAAGRLQRAQGAHRARVAAAAAGRRAVLSGEKGVGGKRAREAVRSGARDN